MYKTGGVSFDINVGRANGRTTNIQFMTQDTGSAKLSFSFTKDGVPLPLSAVDAKIVLLYADGSFYKKSLTLIDKVNGTAEYILSNEELKHYGTVKAEIKLYYANGQALATSFFTFSIAKTLEDQNIIPTADYYIDDFETLRDGINQTVKEISQTVEELREKFADLEAVETKKGAQEKADDAEKKAKAYTDEHANDEEKHITTDERKAWNDKETPPGAQMKVDAHANKADMHVTRSDKDKWNAGQLFKITQDNGKIFFKSNSETTDYNELTATGMYLVYNLGLNGPGLTQCFLLVMSNGNTLVQTACDASNGLKSMYRIRKYDAATWTPWIELETTGGAQSKVNSHANTKEIHVTQADKDNWNDYVRQFMAHNYNQDRHLSAAERAKWNGSISYSNITLKNGATVGTRVPIYAKWGALLLFRGHVRTDAEIIFGSIPAEYAPIGGAVVSIPLSGTGGTANLIVYDNGDLKIKYPTPVDSNKLDGFYIDVPVPLQQGGAT
ncbi:BppU family phage baseplate upper protein [Bacillus amyloliquefaciens]|uniref:BppU family phage baseplate upper protein n=1 Tax=Bacillus amyloliquefaciens TaxID=1390 RepID=UPI001872CF31|nr:BppU family phage baseplate upper protein [Bacillus amyloliquefaciens]QOQ53508.1 phage baseplate upper protein [Bacillus amyloliquefaciens]